MPAPQGVGTVVLGPSGAYRPSVDNDLCKEWRDRAREWCEGTKRTGEGARNFNKRFYDDLAKNHPDLMKEFSPETPLGFMKDGEINVLEEMAKDGDVGANNVLLTYTALGLRFLGETAGMPTSYTDYSGVTQSLKSDPITGKSMCSALNRRMTGQFGSGVEGIHSDGTLTDGTAVEIKGPGDTEGPGQFDKEKKCARNGEVLVIDHEACDPTGDITTDKGNCKKVKPSP